MVKPNSATPTQAHLASALNDIIDNAAVTIHFQQIVDAGSGTILGWEALSRGPSDSPLHSPLVLFEVAAQCNRLLDLERLALKRAVMRFKELNLPGQLFLNVTADGMAFSAERHSQIRADLLAIGIPPSRIVIELTETRAAHDPEALAIGIAGLKSLGFVMAIDDLGEGFASLKRWTEMRPNFVKIDRHFIDGLHRDPIKQQFVRSIVEMAKSSGCAVIGEGVEEEIDLHCLRQLGVNIIQGFLLARPMKDPRSDIKADVAKMLAQSQVLNTIHNVHQLKGGAITARQLARRSATVSPTLTCQRVVDMFNTDVQLYALPVVDVDGVVLGVLRSMDALRRGTEKFFTAITGRQACVKIMDTNPLVFDVNTTLRTMSEVVSSLNDRHLVDGYIVTEAGRYFGSGKMTDLLKAVSDMQIFSARYANPLTLLPGNVPIDEHIKESLEKHCEFVVAYFDLDHFKAFNDVYGYRAGDEVIQLAAQVISSHADSAADFVGHVGGDDFVVVFGSKDWEQRVQRILGEFDPSVRRFFSAEHLAAGGLTTQNRQGVEVFHPLTGLSAGLVVVKPNSIESPSELSQRLAETKKLAKRQVGSSYFVDRRAIAA